MNSQWKTGLMGGVMGATAAIAVVFGAASVGYFPSPSDKQFRGYLMAHPSIIFEMRDQAAANCPNVKTSTKVIEKVPGIPNDGVALVKNFPDDVAKQVKTGMIDYSKTDDGKKVFKALFSWDGMQEITANFYDPIREAAKLAGVDVQGLASATTKPAATPSPSPSKSP